MEEQLAIDIQLKKLLDWLISRRICNRQWHESIIEIRSKIGHAIGDMPEHEKIKNLLSGTNINYFHCKQIVEILKETEKDTKNFFGSYGSQRMKDWQEILRLFERDTIYLAEAAQLLSQACTYEIPGLKKQLAKSIQTQGECDKKEKDNTKKANDFQAEFDKSCKQLGIQGQKIRKEIIELLSELPDTYSTIAEESKGLKPARQLYLDFLNSTLENVNEDEVLPTLSFLVQNGNVTTYQWIHGEEPLSVEEPTLDFGDDDEDNNEGDDAIDFGDDDAGEIDFGDVELEAGGDNIDWGNLGAAEDAEIDWGESAAVVEDASLEAAGIVVEDGGMAGGVARDSEALSLLDNRRTRTMILDELTELQCFLEQRLIEIHAAEEGRFTLNTTSVKSENPEAIQSAIGAIEALTSRLNTGKIHHLQLIRSSPKYVDRLVDSLKQKLSLVSKMKTSNVTVCERRDAAIQEQAQAQRKIEVIKRKTEELQREIEEDISKRYKGRQVNIMGGVQSV